MQRGRCDAQSLAANHRPSPRLVLPSAHISRPPRVLPEAPYARPFSQCLTLLTIASAALARYSPRPHQCRRLVLAALRRSRAVRVLLAARCARQTRETLRARILALVMPSASPVPHSRLRALLAAVSSPLRRPTMLDRGVRARPAADATHPCLLPLLVVLGAGLRTPPHLAS
jgi:hypothetical protein